MKKFLVPFLIILELLFLEIPFLVGSLRTPTGMIYLGTVHFAGDYFYYLSQIAQGTTRFLSSTVLFTGEKLPFVFVGWQNVLVGRLFSFFGLNPIESYQLVIIFFLFFFLLVSYKLICEFFPKNSVKQLLAFFLFVVSTSLFRLTHTSTGWDLSYFDHWYNLGNSFARFGPTPHHLLGNTLAVLIVFLLVRYFKQKEKNLAVVFILPFLALLLSSMTPVHWGIVTGAGFISGLIYFLLEKPKRFFFLFLPTLLLGLGGLPAAFYVKQIFSLPPYSYSSAWETQQQISTNLLLLFQTSGLIIPFAFLGIRNYLRSLDYTKLFGIVFILFCASFYFTGLPRKLALTNARFWPSEIYLFMAVIAAEGILGLSKIFKSRQKHAFLGIILIFSLITLFSDIAHFRKVLAPLDNSFYFYYLPEEVYRTYQKAKTISSTDDLFLVQSPFNWSFPAISGRKSFFGFYLLTINSQEKTDKAADFFSSNMNQKTSEEFLNQYHIDYVIGEKNNPALQNPLLLEEVYQNQKMVISKVRKD